VKNTTTKNFENLTVKLLQEIQTEIEDLIDKKQNVDTEFQKAIESSAYKKDLKKLINELAQLLDEGVYLGKIAVEIPITVYPCGRDGDLDIEYAVEDLLDNRQEIYECLEKAIKKVCKTNGYVEDYVKQIKDMENKVAAFFKKHPINEYDSDFECLMQDVESEIG
jgi:hypothetical protein